MVSYICVSQNAENNLEPVHSPRKATIYSAVLPGLGQAYNQKYWKIPIAYAGIGTFSYLAYKNQVEFNRYKNAYIIRQDNQIDEFYGVYNNQALINKMDALRKQRDLCIIGTVLFYAIQIVDANVDANLFNFDISDDLSFRITPSSFNQVYTRTPVFGLNCTLKF
jgi:hypothetical protein